jgi:hypothetical protein
MLDSYYFMTVFWRHRRVILQSARMLTSINIPALGSWQEYDIRPACRLARGRDVALHGLFWQRFAAMMSDQRVRQVHKPRGAGGCAVLAGNMLQLVIFSFAYESEQNKSPRMTDNIGTCLF